MARREELINEQWAIIEPLIPPPLVVKMSVAGRGEIIVKSLTAFSGFCALAQDGTACLRDFLRTRPAIACSSNGRDDGTLRRVLEILAADLKQRGDLDLSEYFIDGTFMVAKKRDSEWKRPGGTRYEVHGSGRRPWSSSLRVHGVCYAA